MAISFYLLKVADKKGETPIRVSISIQGKRFMSSIGYSISPNKWNEAKQQAKQGASNAKGATYSEINGRLADIIAVFNRLENKAKESTDTITKDDIKAVWVANFKGVNNPTPQEQDEPTAKTFLDYYDEFVKEQSKVNSWTTSTIKRFGYIRKHITDFQRSPTFDTFNTKGLQKYLNYLQEVKHQRNTTIEKKLSFLGWFLRWAVKNKYSTNTDFEDFKPKLRKAQKTIVYLEWVELMNMYHFAVPESKEYLRRVRDVFCFCCFTSLRYSDVYNLKRTDIRGGKINITTIKTADKLQIELNQYSKAILEKYEDLPFINNKALPVISNQKMNEYLKELGELCELDTPVANTYYIGGDRYDEVVPKYELLSTHAGRRTFICNSLAMGIPANVVMKWTGHSDYKAMKPYIDVADSIKADFMNKWNK